MKLEGRIYKSGKFWLIEIPILDAMTQGHTRKEALKMAQDLLETMFNDPAVKFELSVPSSTAGRFEVSSDSPKLWALVLRRLRESSGLSLKEAATRLGQKSKNAYARYERGEVTPTVEKFDELVRAVKPSNKDLILSLH